jgi:hypothetical protein
MKKRRLITAGLPVAFFAVLSMSCTKNELPVINFIYNNPIPWEKEPCEIIYYDGNDSIVMAAEFKCRGGVSRRYDKRSFSVELDKKFGLCSLPTEDDWILTSNYIDKTFMRHKISYDLFREMDTNNFASQCAYVNVEVNYKPIGLYVLMQEINAKTLGLDKSDTMAMLFKDPVIFIKEKLSYVQDSLNYYQQKYPKKVDSDKTYYIEQFKDYLFDSENKPFLDSLNYWVDLQNIIDWHILLLFSNNGDGIKKNFYLYKVDSKTPFRLAIWDYDHSFGRDGDNELNMMERELDCNKSILIERLMNIPESGYRNKLKNRWMELRKNKIISVENFQNYIDNNNELIEGSIEKNFEIWPCNAKWYYDSNSYKQEIDLMMQFVNIRIPQLDDYFSKMQ